MFVLATMPCQNTSLFFAMGGAGVSSSLRPREQEAGGEESENGRTPLDTSKLPQELTSKYDVVNKIGEGSFGSVYKVRNIRTRVVYAAKCVEARNSTSTTEVGYWPVHHGRVTNHWMCWEQVEIQAKMDDVHVVKILDTVSVPSSRCLVIIMEYCEGGNLLQWIKRSRRHELLNEPIIMKIFREICSAVYNCHLKRIIHRDLKPENILLDDRRRIKLGKVCGSNEEVCMCVHAFMHVMESFHTADFGVARILNRKSIAMSFCGRFSKELSVHLYAPPPTCDIAQEHPPTWPPNSSSATCPREGRTQTTWGECQWVLQQLHTIQCLFTHTLTHTHRYNVKCDVWSIGCILWDMANSADLFTFVSLLQ